MGSSPKVAIIILNYNGLVDTLACLESLEQLEYSNYETVLVDNGSSDGSVVAVRRAYPRVMIMETGENLGYAAGNNVGLQYMLASDAAYALLLNNDTVVAPNFLAQLVDTAQTDPLIGVAGPTIYYFDQPDTIWSVGGAIDWDRGQTGMLGLDQPDTGQFGQDPRPVDFVTGCALLVKRQVLEEAGLLDARFFMYFEETEWCTRIRRAGYHIIHVPSSKIWHKIKPGQQHRSPRVHYYMTRNRLLFLRAARAPLMTWGYVFLENLRTLLSWSIRPKWRHLRSQRGIMVKAMRDFWLARFGRVDLSL